LPRSDPCSSHRIWCRYRSTHRASAESSSSKHRLLPRCNCHRKWMRRLHGHSAHPRLAGARLPTRGRRSAALSRTAPHGPGCLIQPRLATSPCRDTTGGRTLAVPLGLRPAGTGPNFPIPAMLKIAASSSTSTTELRERFVSPVVIHIPVLGGGLADHGSMAFDRWSQTITARRWLVFLLSHLPESPS
jgi:hypothetical protein